MLTHCSCSAAALPKWVLRCDISKGLKNVPSEYVFPLLSFLKNHTNARSEKKTSSVFFSAFLRQRFEIVYKKKGDNNVKFATL
jgi:hypothetical protein